MLEQVKTKKQQPALKWQGRWLSSSVDAVSEASGWVRQQGLLTTELFPIVVFGVGSGYHLVALVNEYPGRPIVAIDISQEIINCAQAEHGLVLANVKFICASGPEELQNSFLLQQIVRGPYALLVYIPATVPGPEIYSEMQMYLSGRSQAGLQFLLNIREQLAADLGANTIHATTNEPVSIKTLMGRIVKNCSPETKLLFLTLRELVD